MGGQAWKVGAVAATIMVVLALLGVALTAAHMSVAPKYWIWLVPAYGVLCVLTAFLRARDQGRSFALASVAQQTFHWMVIGGALWLDFYIGGAAEETGVSVGIDALLLLTVGCMLAGVHLDWLFTFVGALLALTLFLVVKAEQYVWLIFVVGGIVALGMLLAVRHFGHGSGASHQGHGGGGTAVPGEGPSHL
jgi:hypothetical protein